MNFLHHNRGGYIFVHWHVNFFSGPPGINNERALNIVDKAFGKSSKLQTTTLNVLTSHNPQSHTTLINVTERIYAICNNMLHS